jgi:hypothetical protein
MNTTKTTLYLITSILAFALLANVNVGAVFATGGLDDEEEEEAIEELQSAVQEIKGTLGTIELNLTEGSNDIQANCPSTEEIVQEVVENITNNNNNNETAETEQPQCPTIQEPEPAPQIPNQTVIPPVEAQPEQNQTGCNPVPEPVENKTSDLVPIICPINGELLGYTNTTSGEQLPISAANQTEQPQSNNTGFLPPIDLPTEQNQTVIPQEPAPQQCNVTQGQEEQPTSTIVPEQNNVTVGNNPVEFDVNCGCYAVDKSPTEEVQ